jgi:hypothetical protein
MTLIKGFNKPPAHFYTFLSPKRWRDEYANKDGSERLVLTPSEIMARGRRNDAYRQWLCRFDATKRISNMKWTNIRIIRRNHDFTDKRDWWENYEEAVLRVFLQPITLYDQTSLSWLQYYVLHPEDSEMIKRHMFEKKGVNIPPRDYLKDPYVSSVKELRKALIIPTKCCHHIANHETENRKLSIEARV